MPVPLLSLRRGPWIPRRKSGQAALRPHAGGNRGALPGVLRRASGRPCRCEASPFDLEVKAEAQPVAPDQPMPRADYRTADPEYFRSAGIPLLAGREFTAGDKAGAPRVVIINQTLADRFFPGEDPLGRRIAWTGDVLRFTPISGEWRTIVGVVGNTRDGGLDAPARASVYMPFAQEIAITGALVVRADSDDAGAACARSPASSGAWRRAPPIEK